MIEVVPSSLSVPELLKEPGHTVLVVNPRELPAIYKTLYATPTSPGPEGVSVTRAFSRARGERKSSFTRSVLALLTGLTFRLIH